MIALYSNEVEQTMKEFFNSLSEKDHRFYAAVEAQKFGRSGIGYIAKVLSVPVQRYMRGLKSWERCLKQSMIPAFGVSAFQPRKSI